MKLSTKQLCVTAVFAAMVFAVTRLIQIPIPGGYFNIGNSIILACCAVLPCPGGIIAGSIGSALADLTSYPVYTLPTLVIKALMPVVFYLIVNKAKPASFKRYMLASAVSTLIPLVGYTLTGCVLYGSFVGGLAQVPGLLLEYAANLILLAIVLPQLIHRKFWD